MNDRIQDHPGYTDGYKMLSDDEALRGAHLAMARNDIGGAIAILTGRVDRTIVAKILAKP
jgi:hypothetical protein